MSIKPSNILRLIVMISILSFLCFNTFIMSRRRCIVILPKAIAGRIVDGSNNTLRFDKSLGRRVSEQIKDIERHEMNLDSVVLNRHYIVEDKLGITSRHRGYLLQQKKRSSEPINQTLLTLFTSFKEDNLRKNIQMNTIFNWSQYKPKLKPVLFTMSGGGVLAESAHRHGWKVAPVPRTNEYGTPFWKDMYFEAMKMSNSTFYGYCNGDILFTDDLIRTLTGLLSYVNKDIPVLLTGRRTNVYVNESDTSAMFTSADLQELSKNHGELFRYDAEDYFIISHPQRFPWHIIKDVVIGRPAYDNYIVGMINTYYPNISLIDATATVLAIHLSGNHRESEKLRQWVVKYLTYPFQISMYTPKGMKA